MKTGMIRPLLALLAPAAALAQSAPADTTLKATFGGFVDTYYAYDFGKPTSLDRSFASGATFTTQPARHNEFNVNLAYVEALVSGDRVHGRLALQAGTAVQSNDAGEPTRGAISGPSLSRNIQEAYAGYQVTPSLWVDAGIFDSHMGMESWASRDNISYTRSLVAEYSPYYSSGVRAIWKASRKLTAHLHVVNGWQNISETNSDKGAGLRLDLTPSSTVSLSYYNFFNDEVGSRLRAFNGAGFRLAPDGRTTLLAQVDYGTIEGTTGSGASRWFGFTLVVRRALNERVALVGRVERYDDPDQVNIVTGLGEPFQGNGASLGVDVTPRAGFLWRSEVRGFATRDAIFPSPSGASPSSHSAFAVSSFALVF